MSSWHLRQVGSGKTALVTLLHPGSHAAHFANRVSGLRDELVAPAPGGLGQDGAGDAAAPRQPRGTLCQQGFRVEG